MTSEGKPCSPTGNFLYAIAWLLATVLTPPAALWLLGYLIRKMLL